MTITMTPFKIFTPSPILGYGFSIEEFWNTINVSRPAAIILDAGSTDPGPYMLGSGKTLCSKRSYVRDLTPILEACAKYKIKLIISSAGGAGTNSQVDILVNIIQEICATHHHYFKLATIKFRENRELILSKFAAGAIAPCGVSPLLTKDDILEASAIVAQMGAEPFLGVLKDKSVDIIVAGRSYDPAPFAAFCINRGVEASTAWHMGKIAECGGLCAVPKGRSILVTMYHDSFMLSPTNTAEKCTPRSVAAHTMYEKTRPDRLPGPGGILHLDSANYIQQADGRTTLVKGSVFVPSQVYQVKLEGAQQVGYRTTFIGGIRDPILIAGIDEFLKTVRATTEGAFPELREGGPTMSFHIYGKNAVMGPLETSTQAPLEIGLLGEVVAGSQEHADAIAGFARTVVLHGAYEGQLATAGNFASPLTPLEQSLGPVYKFSLYHLMDVEDPVSLFPIEVLVIGEKQSEKNGAKNVLRTSIEPEPILNGEKPADAIKTIQRTTPNSAPQRSGSISIREIASVVRSKNSGPFEITLDILFDHPEDFERVKKSNCLTSELLMRLYALKKEDILTFMFYEPALGWKCTFKRPWDQGGVGERDTFGAQQHAPLLSIMVPEIE